MAVSVRVNRPLLLFPEYERAFNIAMKGSLNHLTLALRPTLNNARILVGLIFCSCNPGTYMAASKNLRFIRL